MLLVLRQVRRQIIPCVRGDFLLELLDLCYYRGKPSARPRYVLYCYHHFRALLYVQAFKWDDMPVGEIGPYSRNQCRTFLNDTFGWYARMGTLYRIFDTDAEHSVV